MNIVVCFKQVVDPEAPPSSFRLDPATKTATIQGAPPVIDPYGECAVEASLRIKDANGGKVTALCLGTALERDVVKKPLTMGADELVLLEDQAFEGGDSWTTAFALAAAIKKIGAADVILTGREASDTNAGQVGSGIAEILGLPCATLVRQIEIRAGVVRVEKVTTDGYEVVELPLPAVLTISNELGTPRYPTIKGMMAADRKEAVVWKPADLGLDPSQVGAAGRRTTLLSLFQPVRVGTCEIIKGETVEEAGANLALRLRQASLL